MAVRKESSLEDITKPSLVNWEKCVPVRPAPILGLIAKLLLNIAMKELSEQWKTTELRAFQLRMLSLYAYARSTEPIINAYIPEKYQDISLEFVLNTF